MTYRIEFTKAAERDFRRLDRPVQVRLRTAIDALAVQPRPAGTKKLVATQGFYRISVGDWRVIYQIRDQVLLILVLRIGHRREVYR